MLNFRKISSPNQVAEYLASVVNKQLKANKSVLWLLSGGSAIDVAIEASKLLTEPLSGLAVSLVDERYGPVGHTDSNWQQIEKAGLSLPGAKLHPVLEGKDIDATTSEFSDFLQKQLRDCDYKIALVGIGADGHSLGILPNSPAIDSDQLATHYQGPDFNRITSTAKVIDELDEVVVYAVGESKHQPLDDLEKELPPPKQPAQILKRAKKLIIFNDYKGEAV